MRWPKRIISLVTAENGRKRARLLGNFRTLDAPWRFPVTLSTMNTKSELSDAAVLEQQVEPLVDAPALARAWCVSDATVRRWARAGLLPVVKLPGGAIRFRLEDIRRAVGQK
jgi:hypothetical protein